MVMNPLPCPAQVVFAEDVPRVTAFYQAVAQMQLQHQDDEHAVLELAGFELVVHRLHGAPPPEPGDAPAQVREDAYTKLCLPVDSIANARIRAAQVGGFIRPPGHEWQARGFRACDGHDPEGNVIQVRERAC